MARSNRRAAGRSAERAERMKEARRIEPSKAGLAAGILSILCAFGSYFSILTCLVLVRKVFGAFAVTTETQFFLLNYITGACLVLGGIGLLMRKGWGWWLAFGGSIVGLLDLARLFRGLLTLINPDHPDAVSTGTTIVRWVLAPAVLYVVVLVVLTQRGVRYNFRISSVQRPKDQPTRDQDQMGEDGGRSLGSDRNG